MKRRYNKGYFVDIRSKKHVQSTEVQTPIKTAIAAKGAVVVASTAYVGRSIFEKRVARSIFSPERKNIPLAKSRHFVSRPNDLGFTKGFSSNSKTVFTKGFKGLKYTSSPPPSDPAVFLVLWAIFSILYTLCFLSENPSMNFFAALGIGILAGLFTAFTGKVLPC
jgi:hypothetical protein